MTSPVSVTFSEPMNGLSIDGSTFTLEVAGVSVSGTVTYDAASRVASFMPTGGLLADGQSYVARVTTGVKDVAGNRLVSNFDFAFTTARMDDGPPPGKGNASLWVMVIDRTGQCIPGATIRIVQGQRAGETVTQQTPCTMWEDDGGYIFTDLVAGSEMIFRASAPGYEVREKKAVPSTGWQMATLIVLSKK